MRENRERHAAAANEGGSGAGTRRRPAPLRGVTALAGSLLLAAVVAACGGTGSESEKADDPAPVGTASASPQGSADDTSPAEIITRAAGDTFPGLYAHLSGVLVVTDDDCVAVDSPEGGDPTVVAWGQGWSVRDENGKAAVYDAGGRLFAREGDEVGLAGGGSDRFAGKPCATGKVFEANDDQAAS